MSHFLKPPLKESDQWLSCHIPGLANRCYSICCSQMVRQECPEFS
uniref:Uncharacterized protein n=1 Tax=Anguilla anguilla TaxID=7936 RepID=A0A0E9V9E6_ANGAN